MEETGTVLAVDGPYATVLVKKGKGACEHCTVGTCSLGDDGARIEALNEARAQVGQQVRVVMQPYTFVKGSALLYGVPTLALIAGAILGKEFLHSWLPSLDPDGAAALGGFSLMALSFVLLKLLSRRLDKDVRLKPVLVEILKDSPK